MNALNLISLYNIDLSNEWVCKEPNFLDREDINCETTETLLSTLFLKDEEIHINNDDDFNRNDNLLEYRDDDFLLYLSPQDQDTYFHVKNEKNVWFILFFYIKTFYFFNILISCLCWNI